MEYDFDMLIVLLIIQARKADWHTVVYDELSPRRPVRARLRAVLDELPHTATFADAPPEQRDSFAACLRHIRSRSMIDVD